MATSPVNSSLFTLLTQTGAPLASLASSTLAGVLDSASPQDLITLSNAALQAQQLGNLFGDEFGGQSPFSNGGLFAGPIANPLASLDQTVLESLQTGETPAQPNDPLTELNQTLLQALDSGQTETVAPTVNLYG